MIKFDKIKANLFICVTILYFIASIPSHSQTIVVHGKVVDTMQNPLSYANILAIPIVKDQDIKFAITQENGTYKLGLASNQTYNVTVSYLGFASQLFDLTTTNQDLIKDFVLKENPDQLKEITLSYTPPIVIKKDTITYKVDAFTTGEERKLREVLKKLPGVEVDKEGNVSVQGKKVTKVLVENKTFFTGNSKLAVNNIPANVVDKVEILDNYNNVAMLKGLQDSDDMAMNIKLKEDKKKFAFGDLEVGAGIKDRYLIHPNLFYYSPKTNVNFIGDLNNQGVKSFTFRDYLEFEGGFGKLLSDTGSYFSLFNSDFAQYLNNQDYTANTNQFVALNIAQYINNVTDISGYVITSKSKTATQSNTVNEYLNIQNPFLEDRTVNTNLNTFFTIGKVTIEYNPSFEEDLVYNSFVKLTNNDSNGLINTLSPTQNNSIATNSIVTGINLKQNINYSRKLSKNHTVTLEATYNFLNDKPITEWLTNRKILQGLIPLVADSLYNILQTKKSNAHSFNAIVKDYWVLNNFNHLYYSVGLNTAFNTFFNQDLQKLTKGSINNFNSNDFGNDFGYHFIDTFVGLEYKFQIGIVTFKPMIFYHFYSWETNQLEEEFSNNKAVLLPQFTTKIEFNNSEKINFKYALNARFANIEQLANNFILSSFNSVFKGDSSLDNQLYHTLNLSYYKFSLFKNLNINLNTNLNKKVKHFKSVTQLEGINQFNTQILFDLPEYNWSFRTDLTKKIKNIRYKFNSSFIYNDFYQILNDEINLNISKSFSNTVSAETLFKNYPNLEMGYTKDLSKYQAAESSTNFINNRYFVNLEYDFLKSFIFKADYSFDNYKNKNRSVNNVFDFANMSLFYQKEDTPWGFEINATNLFDIKFKQQNSFNNFLISDAKTFILPRIIMFKISYKL